MDMQSASQAVSAVETDEVKTEPLYAVASECMRQANWDSEEALAIMLSRAQLDGDLRRQLLTRGATAILMSVSSGRRSSLVSVAQGKDDTAALKRQSQILYLETWMVLGKRLGDASPDDLRKNIAMRSARERTEAQHRTFESAVLKRLKLGTKRVRDSLSEEDIRDIARRTLK